MRRSKVVPPEPVKYLSWVEVVEEVAKWPERQRRIARRLYDQGRQDLQEQVTRVMGEQSAIDRRWEQEETRESLGLKTRP